MNCRSLITDNDKFALRGTVLIHEPHPTPESGVGSSTFATTSTCRQRTAAPVETQRHFHGYNDTVTALSAPSKQSFFKQVRSRKCANWSTVLSSINQYLGILTTFRLSTSTTTLLPLYRRSRALRVIGAGGYRGDELKDLVLAGLSTTSQNPDPAGDTPQTGKTDPRKME
jgi:hypothetical protein